VELYTPRYMTRFHCLGGECEDTCCQSWAIIVDKPHLDGLRALMTSPEEKARFEAGFKPLPGGDDRFRHALMVLRESDQHCTFLDERHYCSLHARYGEDALPDVCATYPRLLGRVNGNLELAGQIGCPEVARQVLLADDATDRVPADPKLLGRAWVDREVDSSAPDPYDANFAAVRSVLLGLLHARPHPLGARLYFMAYFADATRDTLRRGAERFDDRLLQRIEKRLRLPAAQAELARVYAESSADMPFAVGYVRDLLRLPVAVLRPPLERLVANELMPFYAAHGASFDGEAAELARVYLALAPLPDESTARLDVIVERYVAYELLRTWFIDDDSLKVYVDLLLLRVAAIRFLVGSLARARGQVAPADIDALAVRSAALFGRMLESSQELRTQLRQALIGHNIRLGHAVSLTRV
jgi:lysine-N-methylase